MKSFYSLVRFSSFPPLTQPFFPYSNMHMLCVLSPFSISLPLPLCHKRVPLSLFLWYISIENERTERNMFHGVVQPVPHFIWVESCWEKSWEESGMNFSNTLVPSFLETGFGVKKKEEEQVSGGGELNQVFHPSLSLCFFAQLQKLLLLHP